MKIGIKKLARFMGMGCVQHVASPFLVNERDGRRKTPMQSGCDLADVQCVGSASVFRGLNTPYRQGWEMGKLREFILAFFLCAVCQAQAQLRVPAFTAYLEHDPDGARVSSSSGISGWADPSLKVLWFGDIKNPGKLDCSVELRLPAGTETKLRLTVAGKSREAAAKGTGSDSVKADFGSFEIATT